MLHDLAETRRLLETQEIDVVRLIFTDVLGITRSKDLLVSQLERSAAHGPAFCTGTWVTTTRGGVLDAGVGSFGDGLPDMVAKLDTDTIRPIPWIPGVAYAIADIDNPDGSRSEIAPRAILRTVLDEYEALGLVPVCGPELEFYFARLGEDGYERLLNKTGRVYTTGTLVDPDGHYLHLLRMLDQLNVGCVRREPRVLPVAVRDQPVAQRGDGRGRSHVPVQVRRQGRVRDARNPRDLPGQAVERRGRQRVPPALLDHRHAPGANLMHTP